MPRFVIQHHCRPDGDEHWDLMLEWGDGGPLRTWALPCPPDPDRPAAMSAQQLADHRRIYLEFEGDIGGGRGTVAIHDAGDYAWLPSPESDSSGGDSTADVASADDAADDAQQRPLPADMADELRFELRGKHGRSHFLLKREPHEGKDLWRLRRLPLRS